VAALGALAPLARRVRVQEPARLWREEDGDAAGNVPSARREVPLEEEGFEPNGELQNA
jgi:hypothetical protein